MTLRPDRIRNSPAPRPPGDLILTLPIPDPALSPNGRSGWKKKSRLTKQHRTRAYIRTKALLAPDSEFPPVSAWSLTYYWPRSKRDDDNAIASAKPYIDGMCTALRIDDRTLSFRSLHHLKDLKNPRLEITFHLAP